MQAREILGFFVLLLGTFAVVSLFGGRGSEHEAAPEVDWASVVDDPAERLTIRYMGVPKFAVGERGRYVQRLLEERFNVELVPVFIDENAYDRKKPLMFAGGNLPDLIWENDPDTLQRDAYHGFLLPIPYEVILTHAPGYIEVLNHNAPVGWLYAYWQGQNWGVPTMFLLGMYPVPGLWRMDWLQEAGITEAPETLEEMRRALAAISGRRTPGGLPVYGMSSDMTAWWWTSFSEVFGAHGVMPFDWQVEGDGVVWGGVTPQARQALATLREWYRDGLIAPSFRNDRMGGGETLEQAFANGRLGYIYYYGRHEHLDEESTGSLISSMQQLDPSVRLAPGRFPVGPGGHRGGRVWGSGGNILAFGSHLHAEPQKVLRILRMIEEMTTDEELFLSVKFGEFGRHWEWSDPELGAGGGIRMIEPYSDINMARREVLSLSLDDASFWLLGGPGPEVWDRYRTQDDLEFRDAWRRPEWALTNALGKPDVVPSAGAYMPDLRLLQLRVYGEIIAGRRSLESFDEFVREWHARGGEQMTREANELYHAREEIYRIVGAGQ